MPTDLLIALRLVKEGMAASVQEVLQSPTDIALAAHEYCNFRVDYERTQFELNKSK